MSGAEDASKQHVAVLAFPFATHASPLLRLTRRISAAAPDVQFSFFSTARSNETLFSSGSDNENIRSYNVADGLPEGFVFGRNPQEPVDRFLKVTPDNFKKAMEEAVEESGIKITCLVTDAFFGFAWEMAEEIEVPWIPVCTSGPRSLISHIDTDLIRENLGIDGSGDELLQFIRGFSSVRARDLPLGIISGDLDSPFSIMLHKMGQVLPQATAVAINSFEEVDKTAVDELKSRLKMFLNVGPFILASPPPPEPDVHGCIEWLDNHEPASVAYISFGSVITPPRHELAALAEALEAGGFPFLWSFRGNKEDYLPQGFLENTSTNGKFVPWAPQMQVLAHSSVGAFMTHCGWNSILESIIGGVPMISRPFFGDQNLNTRTLETVWGIGVGVEGGVLTKNETKKAFEIVLLDEEGRRMREKIKDFKELAINAVKSNGTSTENFETLVEIVTNKRDTNGEFSHMARFYSAKSMF